VSQRQPPCDEIEAQAPSLMAMTADAPERQRAEAHARSCVPCARALQEGRQLLALIEGQPLPAPSPAALQRAAAPILRELQGAPRFAAVVAAAVLAAWALPLAMMRTPVTPGRALASSIALGVLAALTSAFVVTRAGRGAGLFVLLSAVSVIVPGATGGLETLLGLHCALTEALTAAGVGAAAFLAARALGVAVADKRVLASALGGGALAGHAALEVGCRASHGVPHVLSFHTAPVALAVVLALLVASRTARRAAAS
jgi:hypothetical protein